MTYMWIALFLLALVILFVLQRVLFPKDTSNAKTLMNTYRYMTPTLLEQTPDEQLVKAVVANLLAKAEDANLDAYAVIPALSQERCALYSVWLFMRELQSGDPASLRRTGQFGFSELAADGLDLLGFDALAGDLREYLQTAEEVCVASMKQSLEQIDLNTALIRLVRDNPDAFCDGDTV